MSSRTTKPQQPSQPQAAGQPTVPQLCDFCHAKPRYGTHPYCGKNCATQAITLCHQCNVKNKHGTYNYCGKKCATLASAGKPGAPPQGVGTIPGTTNGAANQPVAVPPKGVGAGSASGNGYPAKRGWKPAPAPGLGTTAQYAGASPFISTTLPVPFQVAPLLNHIQSLASTALSNISNLPSADPGANLNAPATGAVPAYSSTVNETLATILNMPAANTGLAASYPNGQQVPHPNSQPAPYPDQQATAKGHPPPQKQPVQAQEEYEEEEDMVCRIRGCGQPVHGTSEYCSTRHREEAVTLQLEEACIMCLKLPQSEKDYFCGRICREEALSKIVDV